MDELFEALTLIQTGKIEQFPVVLIGRAYWQPLMTLLNGMRVAGTIAAEDISLVLLTDDLDEAVDHLERHAIGHFGLRARREPKSLPWLGEPAPIPSAIRSPSVPV
jgi:hypothetical protein